VRLADCFERPAAMFHARFQISSSGERWLVWWLVVASLLRLGSVSRRGEVGGLPLAVASAAACDRVTVRYLR